jgi:DNA-binding transcriptional ArsR family regulator
VEESVGGGVSKALSAERDLSVVVTYGDARVEFSGSPEVVLRSLHEFVSKVVPNMDLARAITANYSVNDIIQLFKDYIRVTPEGPRVWIEDKRLSDRDVILLQLVAAKASNLTGKGAPDAMSATEIQEATGLNPKTISSRLSELTKTAQVERVEAEGGGRYRISTLGVHRLNEQLSKKLKQGQGSGAAVSP